ncbi:hypothetical protein D9M68_893140 [compost metagenome]
MAIVFALMPRLALQPGFGCRLPKAGRQRTWRRQQHILVAGNEAGVQLCRRERRVRENAAQEGDVGLQSANGKLVEHGQQAQACLFAVFTPGNQLAQHRVVERRHHIAFADPTVHPPTFARCRFTVQRQFAGRG